MNYELWSMKYELLTVKYEVWTVNCEVWSTNYELWSMKCEVWSTNYELWSMNCEVWIMKYEQQQQTFICNYSNTGSITIPGPTPINGLVRISNLDGAMNWGHKQTDLVIMDFAKAFHKVPHRRLLHKLDYYGKRGSTHKWISSCLSGRSQQAVLDGQASDPAPVLAGVPEGSVLWQILF